MAPRENPTVVYYKAEEKNSVPLARTSEHKKFYDLIKETLLTNLSEYSPWKYFKIGIVKGLPICPNGLGSYALFCKNYIDNFKVSWKISFDKDLLNKGIFVSDTIDIVEWKIDIKSLAETIKGKIEYIEKNENSDSTLTMNKIKHLILIDENLNHKYSAWDIVNSMRTWEEQNWNWEAELEINWKKIELSKEELEKLNDIVFRSNKIVDFFKKAFNSIV